MSNCCPTQLKATPDMGYDKTMKFWAELSYSKSMTYTNFHAFQQVSAKVFGEGQASVEYCPASVKGFWHD